MEYYTDISNPPAFAHDSQVIDFICSIAVFISAVKVDNIFKADNIELRFLLRYIIFLKTSFSRLFHELSFL